jgi:hypothetical protein
VASSDPLAAASSRHCAKPGFLSLSTNAISPDSGVIEVSTGSPLTSESRSLVRGGIESRSFWESYPRKVTVPCHRTVDCVDVGEGTLLGGCCVGGGTLGGLDAGDGEGEALRSAVGRDPDAVPMTTAKTMIRTAPPAKAAI